VSEVFPNAPLALVAFEVRYLEEAPLTARPALGGLKAALAEHLPLRDDLRQHEVALRVGAPEAPAVQVTVVPRFTTRDRTTACQVSPTSLIIETTAYAGFDPFLTLIHAALRAVADVAKPDGVTRIGLRYIDEIRVPGIEEPPGEWRGYIDEHLLAPVADEFVKAAQLIPHTWQGVVQYGTGPDRAVVLRYGPAEGYAVPPGGPTRRKDPPPQGLYFLLDSDSFWQPSDEIPTFDPETLVAACRELHTPVRALFDTVVTNRLVDEVFRQPAEEGGVA
jgi:uncharacterized protein (TIGR04255 family)